VFGVIHLYTIKEFPEHVDITTEDSDLHSIRLRGGSTILIFSSLMLFCLSINQRRCEMKKSLSRRDFLQTIAMTSAGVILSACVPAVSTQPTQSEDGNGVAETPAGSDEVKITFWTYPGDEGFLGEMFELYRSSNPQVNLDLVKITNDDMTQKLAAALVAGAGAPDLADIEQGYFRKWVYGPGLLDLRPYGVEQHKEEIPSFAWTAGQSPDMTKTYFLYYSIGCAVIHYRRSLFKTAGLPEDPDGVADLISKSWEDNLTTGEKISKESGPWMFDNASTVFGMYRDLFNPVWYDEVTGKFQINTPEMLDGLELTLDARNRGLDAKVNQWTPEWETTFNSATVASYPSGDWLLVFVQEYGGEATKGDWGMVPVPGTSGASAGGSLFCAFEQSKLKDEAYRLMSFLAYDLEAQLLLLDYYNFPALKKAWDNPKMDEPVDWYGGQKIRQISVDVARKFSDRIYTAYDNDCSNIVFNEVTNVVEQGKDPKQALADAQATAESQIEIKS
jgi:ABC-type glycerol-3-phosphate transport system substrate-binding protein